MAHIGTPIERFGGWVRRGFCRFLPSRPAGLRCDVSRLLGGFPAPATGVRDLFRGSGAGLTVPSAERCFQVSTAGAAPYVQTVVAKRLSWINHHFLKLLSGNCPMRWGLTYGSDDKAEVKGGKGHVFVKRPH